MNYPSKSNVPVAASRNNKFDLTKQVVTTSDFGRIKPIECRYMVPGDSFNVKVSSFTRLAQMVSPTLGKIDCIQRAYFVPIRSICRSFYDQLTNKPFPRGLEFTTGSRIPRTNMYSFVTMFCQTKYSTLVKAQGSGVTPPDSFDFYIAPGYNQVISDDIDVITSGSTTFTTGGWFNFTNEGRKLYDFYTSLGFNISFEDSYSGITVSLFPILAFWKMYYDWILPSRFYKDFPWSIAGFIEKLVSENIWNRFWNSPVSNVYEFAQYFGRVPYAFYDNDIFTSAWLQPFEPDLMRQDINIPNPGTFGANKQVNGVTSSDGSTGNGVGAHIETSLSSTGNIDQNNAFINYFTIQSLGRLQDYLNRGMLAGSKVQDWLLTEFGMRPSTDALDLSTYLGKISDTIRIGDVMSMSDTRKTEGGVTSGQGLGAYAGQAKGGAVGTFKYHAREHGYFIITTEIIPKTSYYQGLTPEFTQTDILDFFQPEFDSLGVEAVAHKDMFCSSRKYDVADGLNPNNIFGFVPRYAKLKTAFDVVSGDFRTRFGDNLKSWYLARDVEKYLVDKTVQNEGVVSMDFCAVDPDTQDWDNIFSYIDDDVDHFIQIFVIENAASRPMKSIADALRPEHNNSSKEVQISTNGNKD